MLLFQVLSLSRVLACFLLLFLFVRPSSRWCTFLKVALALPEPWLLFSPSIDRRDVKIQQGLVIITIDKQIHNARSYVLCIVNFLAKPLKIHKCRCFILAARSPRDQHASSVYTKYTVGKVA